MSVSKQVWAALGFASIVVVAFQNCSKGLSSASVTEAAPSVSTVAGGEDDGGSYGPPVSPGPGPTPAPTPTQIDSTVCAREYFTAFPWDNANEFVGNPNEITAVPHWGTVKYKSFKIYSNSPPNSGNDATWYMSTYLAETIDSSGNPVVKNYTLMDKRVSGTTDTLLCFGANNITFGLQDGKYTTVGSMNSTGYFACRINGGGTVRVQSADGTYMDFDSARPFVLKRGCFQ